MSQELAHSNKNNIHSWDRFSYQEEEIYLALCNAPLTPTWPIFLEMVRERFDSPEQVETIELGSGYGKFSLCANLIGCRTTLIDYNRPTVEQIKRVFAHFGREAEVFAHDALRLPPELRGRFDFSSSFGTAEHFIGPERFEIFRSHAQVLKPGGRVLICVPNAFCLPYRIALALRMLAHKWPKDLPEVPFTPGELMRLGARAGLRHCRVVACSFLRDDVRYWLGENVRSVLRKMTGFPRRPSCRQESFPSLEDISSSLSQAMPLQTSFLSRHFSYMVALVGEK